MIVDATATITTAADQLVAAAMIFEGVVARRARDPRYGFVPKPDPEGVGQKGGTWQQAEEDGNRDLVAIAGEFRMTAGKLRAAIGGGT